MGTCGNLWELVETQGNLWELRENFVGTSELEGSHGNVVGTSWVPWELVGNL